MGIYRRYAMPVLVDWALDKPLFGRLRKELLQDVSGEILEIGVGTGLNLPCYPPEIRQIHAIDTNQGNTRRLAKREGPKVVFSPADGAALPYDDNRFDFVVSTWTLCSIQHLQQALREFYRVLCPGGSFVFLEHGRHQSPGVQRWQDRLNPVQKIVGDGCHLNRPYMHDIEEAGFELQHSEIFVIENMARLVQTQYRGRAVKLAA